jgi:DNA-binding FadR family transcriptional regulator
MTPGPGETVAPATFSPVVQIRAHEYVAEQIRRHIQLRLSGPGEALPSERELAKQFGVGRPTIQMALRLLEAERLIEVRRGRNGGTFILGPAGDDARLELITGIVRRRDEVAELIVFRETVEPQIAAAAAVAREPADVKRIRAAVESLDGDSSEAEYMRDDTELHLAIGAATHNRYLTAAAEAIRSGLNDVISLLPESELWQVRVAEEHHELLAAIERRDAAAAATVMKVHIEHTGQGVDAVLAAIERRDPLGGGR